ncbi:MAG: hypothetical protein WBB01_17690 [Phormidesmis sp.]
MKLIHLKALSLGSLAALTLIAAPLATALPVPGRAIARVTT